MAVKTYNSYKDSGIPWIGQIPQNWILMRLQFSLNEIKEKNYPIKSTQILSLVKDIGVILYEEKGNLGNISKEDISEYKLAYPNTLILNSMNILIGSVGISNYLGCVSPVYYVFKETEKSDLRFINYIFTTREFQKELRRYANGIMEIRLRVSAQDILKREIALPSKQEQQAIADYLDDKCAKIDKIIETEKAVIEKLKEYKQSLITETITKGLNPSAPMKDSGIPWIGKIPAHWEVYKLKKTVEIISDIDHYMPESVDNGYPYLMTGDLQDRTSKIDFKNCKKVSENDYNDLSSKIHPILDDIIFARYATIGTLCYVDITKDFLVSYSCLTIRTKPNKLLGKFLYYYLKSDTFKIDVNQYINSNTQSNIGLDSLQKVYTMLPPKEEQKNIAEYLDDKCAKIDKSISDKEQVIEKLTEYKKSLIYECITGKRKVI